MAVKRKKITKRKKSPENYFKPYIYINLSYIVEYGEEYNAYDDRLKKLASRYDGELEGSGFGFGVRDISFLFYDLKKAAAFAKAAVKQRGVERVTSNSCLHEDDD